MPTLETALQTLRLAGLEWYEPVLSATDAMVWRVSIGGRELAIRVLREDQRSVIVRELAGMRTARAHGIPAPEIIAAGMIEDHRPVMALTWVPGRPVADILVDDMHLASRLGRAGGRLLARMHQLPVTEDALLAENAPETPPEAGQRRGPSLLHLDYHPFNLQAIGGRLTGVLDWTNAAYGDPRADVARSVSLMRVIAPAFIAGYGARRMALSRFTRGFLAGYAASSGPIEGMAPFYARAGEYLMGDLGSKLHYLPVDDPDLLRRRMQAWTDHWREVGSSHNPR